MRLVPLAVLLLVAPPVLIAQAPQPGPAQPATATSPSTGALPVRRVVLYKTGVGYFEHLGRVRDRQDVTVRFTSRQLDDVLKSLTTIDLGGGQVSSISYNSVAPLEQRLGALRLPLQQGATSADLYGALRGARVEVTSAGGVTAGRLLGVERIVGGTDADPIERTGLTVIGDSGEVRTFELGPGVRVRVLERDLREEIDRYLDLVGSTREQDARSLVISTSGQGERSLFVSYVSEVPIWKSTYRLVLPAATGKPLLQGWAIVDNTIGEDWSNVELSLVAGAPQSFIQPISQPYYGRRSVVPMPSTFQSAPQTHQGTLTVGRATVTGVARDVSGAVLPGVTVSLSSGPESAAPTALAITNANGEFRVDAPAGTYRLAMNLPGFRSLAVEGLALSAGEVRRQDGTLQISGAMETVIVSAESPAARTGTARGIAGGGGGGAGGGIYRPPPPPAPAAPMRESIAPDAYAKAASQNAAADAAALGDLFEYRLATPLTLAKNQSALVPIVSAEVTAEKVSMWNQQSASGRPLRAVWLQNSSGLTLDGGSMTIVDGNAFAGEGLVEPLKPGERRLISYGTDLGVLIRARQEAGPARVISVRAHDGYIIQQSERRATWTYTARNENEAATTLVIEHQARPGVKVDAGQAPAESSPTAERFRLVVDAGKEAALTVRETESGETRFATTDVSEAWIAEVVSQGVGAADMERALRPVLEARAETARLEQQLSGLQNEMIQIGSDQGRLRENMKALRGSREEKALLERYTRQLDQQEDRLEALNKEIAGLTGALDHAQMRLAMAVASLSFDIQVPR